MPCPRLVRGLPVVIITASMIVMRSDENTGLL